MKRTRYFFPALVLALLLPAAVLAQDPGSGGPQPGTPDPTTIPIDGGASLLLAGGVAYALRRLRRPVKAR